VFAVRPLATGATVARVPRALMITSEMARKSSIGRQIRDGGMNLSGNHSLLAAWLVAERSDPRSPFHPYFDTLPTELSSFPIHFSPAELELLTGSLAEVLLAEQREVIDDDYTRLSTCTRLFRPVRREEFVWARLCVSSRVFGLTIDGIETSVLVPFGDMFNHERRAQAGWDWDQETETFTLRTLVDLEPGDEVGSSYGHKGNSRLLVQYGFCIDPNEDDEAELRFPGERGRTTQRCFQVTRDPDHPSARRMIDWLVGAHGIGPEATSALVAAAQAALARFPTTMAEDDALLVRPDLSGNARNCVLARRGEKKVLYAWLALTLRASPAA
jgi:histone-lysine N-methyltransferase SETD3